MHSIVRGLKIISSQVGQITPQRRTRWTTGRRLETAIKLLNDSKLDKLINHVFPYQKIEKEISKILAPENDIICPAIKY